MVSGARRVTPEVGGDTCVLCVSGKNVCNTHWKTIGGDYELWRPVCELSGSVDAFITS